jgi:murein DD-endopeptidase MepM/ murein hydrolase activator NlpD
VAAVGRPVAESITCRTGCLGLSTATAGSIVRVTGEDAGSAASIIFLGGRGARDDRTAAARPIGPAAAEATLPAGARGGPVRLVTGDARRSLSSREALAIRGPSRRRPALDARVVSRRALVDAARRPGLDVFVGADGAADVVVDLVRPADGAVLGHWVLSGVAGGTVQTVEWDGTAAGAVQPEGRYVFRAAVQTVTMRAMSVTGAAASTAVPERSSSFLLLRNRFPVAGPHAYGEGAARFGAGRGGRGHQGQDVFADCGTPLVAAHGGTVKFAGTQRLAGNYVVIAGDDGNDHVYMHLRDPALVAKGAAVSTGQQIGFVGDTGRAHGCHVHFEVWPAPGWYSGGRPVDPLPSLQAWDAGADA